MVESKNISCRKARRGIQDMLDRIDLAGVSLPGYVPREIVGHFDRCPSCSRYYRALSTFAPALRAELDGALGGRPAAALEKVFQQEEIRRALRAGGDSGAAAALRMLQSAGRCLYALASRRRAVWAGLSVAGLLLASTIGLRLWAVQRTDRVIREQVQSVVELIYGEPLLPDVESALLRSQPDLGGYLEEMDGALEGWFQETEAAFD
jgi:hypothetical protein